MINIVVMSKNRPMQLEACLRSLKINFKEYSSAKVSVIFKATDKEYVDGYRQLFGEYPEADFIHETDFKTNTLSATSRENKYTMFVMDDILFKNEFSIMQDKPFQLMAAYASQVLAVSLRLHKGISYCYATDKSSALPKFLRDVPGEVCLWNYPGCEGDWGYGYSLDANIYNTDHIFNAMSKVDFYNPNTLEASLNARYTSGLAPTYLICYPDKSKMINVPANRVQNVFQNKHEGSWNEKDLNDKFLNNERISLDNVLNLDCNVVHYPLDYKFI